MSSSFDSIYKKMASSLEQSGAGSLRETAHRADPARHISPVVAHELNNILTIVQGYAERLLLKHHEDMALQPHLKLISEAAKRATTIIREATPPSVIPGAAARPNQNLQSPQQPAA
jgi:signal transduction histidine kinase